MPSPAMTKSKKLAGSDESKLLDKLTKNAPSQSPGMTRLPMSMTAPKATPEGGQSGDGWPPGIENSKPNRPDMK